MEVLNTIKSHLAQLGDPERVKQMENYLRNQFSFYGVMSSPRKELLKELKPVYLDVLSANKKRELVKALWNEDHRECQLFAIDWMINWKNSEYNADDIIFLEWLITHKSWWDTVDGIAPNLVAQYAQKFPKPFETTLEKWKLHPSFWIRRTCLIYQLKYRENVNLDRLHHFIGVFKIDKEFFIQKAIGWSLRQVSKSNAGWVKTIVEQEGLTGLAKREALKYVKI